MYFLVKNKYVSISNISEIARTMATQVGQYFGIKIRFKVTLITATHICVYNLMYSFDSDVKLFQYTKLLALNGNINESISKIG